MREKSMKLPGSQNERLGKQIRTRNLPGPDLFLEPNYQRELNQTRIAQSGGYLSEAVTRRYTRTRSGSIEPRSRQAELGMIKQIKELRPEFDPNSFRNRCSLEDRKIKVLGRISAKH